MHFIFTHKDNINTPSVSWKKNLKKIIDKPRIIHLDNSYIFITEKNQYNDCLIEHDEFLGYLIGYARNLDLGNRANEKNHHNNCIKHIIDGNWPLNENYTGNFSLFAVDKIKNHLIIANDIVGGYPIYYCIDKNSLTVSSSINLISIINGNKVDEVGILEKLITGKIKTNWSCTFGTRTILKNTKRLLPGENINIDLNKNDIFKKTYDNSLSDLNPYDDESKMGNKIADMIKEEMDICFLDTKDIILGMGGGLDSRLVLGAISENINAFCVNYGDVNSYETKIAQKSAFISKNDFQSFNAYEHPFPIKNILKNYLIKTEAVGYNEWISIHENIDNKHHGKIFILGDILDLFTYKNGTIKKRRHKTLLFLKTYLLNVTDRIFLKKNTKKTFKKFRNEIISNYFNILETLDYYKKIDYKENIKKSIKRDLDELFKRIESQEISSYENINEVFALFTKSRYTMFEQLLLSKKYFRPLNPIGSMRLVRLSMKFPCQVKLNQKLIDMVFKNDRYRFLNNLPTAAIPWVPNKYNTYLKHTAWFLRVFIDVILNRIRLRIKMGSFPNRLIKTFDNLKIYKGRNVGKNISSYFENDHIALKDECLGAANERARLNQWPTINLDIIIFSALNMQIDEIIKNENSKKKDF